mmetsp:Transcript_2494/g.2991  ORF Transcript_2494/g.2991 Transcript_2494/m.2991 type:complete len:224 (+) Transcript_2494:85-756(+)
MKSYAWILPLVMATTGNAFSFTTAGKISPSSSIRTPTSLYADVVEETTTTTTVEIEPKEMVKLFGRLAEKYIMLDSSGGMCCYSACKDCEFRLPDGGYRMADQSSARPKWIPTYEERIFESQNKEHVSKWSIDLYTTHDTKVVTKDEFVTRLVESKFVPPLGGPFMSASASGIDDTTAAEKLFDMLAGDKEKLTKHTMSKSLKVMSQGEEGLTWAAFEKAFSA